MKRSDVRAYVEKIFGLNPIDLTTIALGKSLLEYIDENKLLLDTSTPLMVLLISWYWAATNGRRGIPERVGEFYDDIVTIMYDNFMKSDADENPQSTRELEPGLVERMLTSAFRLLTTKFRNGNLMSQKKITYFNLGELAVDGLTPTITKIVFTEEEVKKSCGQKYLDQARGMGILCRRGEHTLHFFHKSGQEFFAGYYLQNNLSKLASYLQSVKTLKDALSISPVLIFASRSKIAAKMIVHKLLKIFKSKIPAQKYNDEELPFDDLRCIQKYIELCLECNFEADAKAEFVSIHRGLFVNGKVLFHGISSKTAIALAYFMNYCDSKAISDITLRPVADVSDQTVGYGPSMNMFDNTLRRMKYLSHNKIQQIRDSFVASNPDLHEKWILGHSATELAAYIPCIQAYEGLPSASERNIVHLIHSFKNIRLKKLNVNYFKLGSNFDDLLVSIEEGNMQSLLVMYARSTASTQQQITKNLCHPFTRCHYCAYLISQKIKLRQEKLSQSLLTN
ncbi:uncharacterized protein [Amphiura filiformis]|uniref:uncharacterized protein isoform X1 n=1 Tax=Amphiura filiformis TaxID=82378 RepID=UPI003B227BAE